MIEDTYIIKRNGKREPFSMEKIRNGGILVTCSCSGSLSREEFRTVLAWSAKDAGAEVQVLETLGQAQDHPVRLSFPESEYL